MLIAAGLILKNAWETLFVLVKTYWKQLLVLLAAMLLCYYSYNWGYEAADSSWVTFNNARIKELNDKIARLEETSRVETAKLKEDNAKLVESLDLELNTIPPIPITDKLGKKLVCNNKPVTEVYLGEIFTDGWNNLNALGALK